MSVYQELPNHPPHLMQPCPFCGQKQPVYIRGLHLTTVEGNDGRLDKMVHPDLGYSFCNCKNIWYTNWSNIWQSLYDEMYEEKHKVFTAEGVFKKYLHNLESQIFPDDIPLWKIKFLDLGSVTPYLLDVAKTYGVQTIGCDIIPHKDFGHKLIVGDFEKVQIDEKFDIIFASHIFEHFHYPLVALQKCFDLLNPKGRLFVAQPDTFFIDWNNVYTWLNWHVREHHIFFDKDTFVEEAEKIGFQTLMNKRNVDFLMHVTGDMQLVFRKP
jgi:SAM-dependent methyltransferase